jgi:hypothetical protein
VSRVRSARQAGHHPDERRSHDEHGHRLAAGVAVRAGDGGRIGAVREVVGEHRARTAAHLEGRACRHAVHGAVTGRRGRRRQARPGRVVVVPLVAAGRGLPCGRRRQERAERDVDRSVLLLPDRPPAARMRPPLHPRTP